MPQTHLPLLAAPPHQAMVLPPLNHQLPHQPFPSALQHSPQRVYSAPRPSQLLPPSSESSYVDLTLSGPLRRGKWTRAEEDYAAATISYFCDGLLAIQYGTTLRGFLAQQLHCDPMRISKKLLPGSVFAGIKINPKIGRRAYYPCAQDSPAAARSKENAAVQLTGLRRAFIQSIEEEEALEAASNFLVKDHPAYPFVKTAVVPLKTSKAGATLARKRSYDDINRVVRAQQQLPPQGHSVATVKLTEPQIVYHLQSQAQSALYSGSPYATTAMTGSRASSGSKLPKLVITDDVSRRPSYLTQQLRSVSPVTVATSTLVLPPLRVSLVRASMC